ncbi:MAG: L-seryl-tRNA(Sec) selenium transferase, partial [Planctomycetota bacterium]
INEQFVCGNTFNNKNSGLSLVSIMKKTAVSEQKKSILREIPSTEEMLQFNKTTALLSSYPRSMIVEVTRNVLETLRNKIKASDKSGVDNFMVPDKDEIFSQIENEVHNKVMPQFRKSINATGIVLHTGLGRAVLPSQSLESLYKHLKGCTRLAIDLKSGLRKDRDKNIDELICEVTGAEAATVVNNNAAATVLILNALAKGKQVICSRGQMVEIGGSFRIPDIMEISMAKLKGVGTTNRTHLKDYEKAINSETGAILKVHASNYRIIGFTSTVPIDELVKLGHKHKLPVIDDIGSGALIDLTPYGLPEEPLVSDSIKAGADVICFSADKLMGGPQAGIIIGKKKYIELIRKNPLYRAFRVCKLTLIALEETLKLFRDKDRIFQSNPTLHMLTLDIKTLQARADNLVNKLAQIPNLDIKIIDEFSQTGSGSLSGYDIPTKAIALKSKTISSQKLAEKLREREIPVFTRLKDNNVLLDLRTILDGEEDEIIKIFKEVL